MAILKPLEDGDGSNSLFNFIKYLMEKHKNEGTKYIMPLTRVIDCFTEFGTRINQNASKNFPPFKTIKGTELAELRTYKLRYFIYHAGNDVWIGLHGYEKQGNETPKKELDKAKKELSLWKRMQKEK